MEPNDLQLSSTSDSESETREVMLTEEATTSNEHPVYTTMTIKKKQEYSGAEPKEEYWCSSCAY